MISMMPPQEYGTKPNPADWIRYLHTFSSMLKSRIFTNTPFFLAHAMTYGCNSRCQSCTYWKNTPRMKDDLKTDEVFQLLDEAYDAGMRGYYMFGGEPLIRRDIGEIVDYAKQKGFVTVMNTNGSLLEQKAEELKGLDFAFVSIDYHDEYDDIIRGRAGNFREVISGIDAIRKVANTKVAMVTTVSTLNYDTIIPMAQLAKKLGVGISYNSIEQTLDFGLTDGETSSNFDIGLSPENLQEFYKTLLQIKRDGYPLMETELVLRHFVEGRSWKCHFPKMFVYVTPDKKIYNCDYIYHFDLKKGPFEEYFNGQTFRDYVKQAESCNKCIRTCVRGYSYTYNMFPRQIFGLAGDGRKLFNSKDVPNP